MQMSLIFNNQKVHNICWNKKVHELHNSHKTIIYIPAKTAGSSLHLFQCKVSYLQSSLQDHLEIGPKVNMARAWLFKGDLSYCTYLCNANYCNCIISHG